MLNKKLRVEHSPHNFTLILNGTEKDCFDVMPKLRAMLRKNYQYVLLHDLERKITRLAVWNNIHAIHDILKEYIKIKMVYDEPEKVETVKPIVLEPKKKRTLSLEHIRKMQAGRKKS
jgi:hypothetical protein